MMRSQKKLKPGQPGTKKLLDQYGGRLLCVRYRYDAQRGRSIKTAEIIVEESEWHPRRKRIKPEQIVGVRVGFREYALQQEIKKAGGKWNPRDRLWEMRYDQATKLGLTERIEQKKVPNNGKRKVSTIGK